MDGVRKRRVGLETLSTPTPERRRKKKEKKRGGSGGGGGGGRGGEGEEVRWRAVGEGHRATERDSLVVLTPAAGQCSESVNR